MKEMTFNEFQAKKYREWRWKSGVDSFDESINQEVWASSVDYLDVLDEWDEMKAVKCQSTD